MEGRPNVLILCTGNSCRSQMAAGFLRQMAGDRFNVLSAGTDPADRVHPLAIEVMAERGIDISGARPTDVGEYLGRLAVRHLIIVCQGANQSCPRIFPGMLNRHFWPFDDPAAFEGTPAATLEEFRAVRDQIEGADSTMVNGDSDMTEAIQDAVRAKYGAVAESGLSTKHDGVRAVAEAFGYSADELAAIPAEANMGLSCGNPTAFATLRAGETVVDLGCGGGLDVFLAAKKVGPTGRAIGIDMTPEMLDLARRNAAQSGVTNVEFHQATIDRLPLADATVDCVISNCVINLAPDKRAVFREIARVLKPGGRLAVSDIALKQPLPAEIGASLMAYIGCIAGAISLDEYRAGLAAAGFDAVEIVESGSDLNAYAKVENQSGCCSPAMTEGSLPVVSDCCSPTELHGELAELLRRYNVNDYAASVKVYAVKPR